MNKAALVEEVQKLLSHGASKAAAERATEAVLAAVKRGLRRDKEVALVGFGTFAMAVRPVRNGFNPHTKRPMKIRAIKTIRFRPGAELRGLAGVEQIGTLDEVERAVEESRSILKLGSDWDGAGSSGYAESTWNRARTSLS